MKKTLLFSFLWILLFLISGFALLKALEWAAVHNLGAEMALGLIIPAVFLLFMTFAGIMIVYSVVISIVNKNVKLMLPVVVYILFYISYYAFSNENALWINTANF